MTWNSPAENQESRNPDTLPKPAIPTPDFGLRVEPLLRHLRHGSDRFGGLRRSDAQERARFEV